MIDWWFVAVNALWIFGASVVLAAFSYHHWLAQETGRRLREIFRERSWRIFYPMGATIFCLGWLLRITPGLARGLTGGAPSPVMSGD